LNEEFGPQGLSIVAVTNESKGQTEPWIESKGVRYAYAYDRGGKLSRALGVRGIPNAVLVDASGTIIWQGHPGNLEKSTIKEALGNAIKLPIYEWGKSAKSIKKAFLKGDYGKAIAAADKLAKQDDNGAKIGGILRGMLASQVSGLQSSLKAGDVHRAYAGAKALYNNVKGLPERDLLDGMLKDIAKSPELSKLLDVQSKLADILGMEREKRKDCDGCTKKLKKLLRGYEGTHTGELIEAAIEEMRLAKGKMTR